MYESVYILIMHMFTVGAAYKLQCGHVYICMYKGKLIPYLIKIMFLIDLCCIFQIYGENPAYDESGAKNYRCFDSNIRALFKICTRSGFGTIITPDLVSLEIL